jgi:predicted O-methyltransferase YrrM
MSSLHRLARRVAKRLLGVTSRTATGLLVLALAGAGVAVVALTGRVPLALALLTVLVTGGLAGLWQLARRATGLFRAQHDAIHDLRLLTEQVQRRVIAAVEKERLEAGDRHLETTAAIARADRLTPEGAEALLRGQCGEIEAMLQLFRTVDPRAPMPAAAPGPRPADMLGLLHLVRSRRPGLTVALGAGPATIWLGYAAEQAGRLVVVDHDADRVARARADVMAHGLTGTEIVHAAPAELSLGSRTTDWYDVDALDALKDIGLLVLAGPAPSESDALAAALHVLGRRLAPGAAIVTEDGPIPRPRGFDGLVPAPPPAGRWTVLSHPQTLLPS